MSARIDRPTETVPICAAMLAPAAFTKAALFAKCAFDERWSTQLAQRFTGITI